MSAPSRTGYCSERCLLWSFFGVPALRRRTFLKEQRRNRALRAKPAGWTRPVAYPDLGSKPTEPELTRAVFEVMKAAGNLPPSALERSSYSHPSNKVIS